VDRFSKMAHFIPVTSMDTAQTATMWFWQNIWWLHGLPTDTVSDRGSNFENAFTRGLYKHLGIKPHFSTAYHPQTDGQTECINAILKTYICIFCNYRQNDWEDHIDLAEFAYNNRRHSLTGVLLFLANYGYHPNFGSVLIIHQLSALADSVAESLFDIHNQIRSTLTLAQDKYKNIRKSSCQGGFLGN
jgi:transposase InsO family protein